ncbi:hypothetical protein GLA29479_3269 [Lysobacter antibioticus]|jgi:hypothetical protein|nr:hypothetical protein GLA29479_3269 [Lysobacter antibioticus]
MIRSAALSLLLALAIPADAWATAARAVCPPLPPASGLRWLHQQGPDFELCYAGRGPIDQNDPDREAAFSVYLGNFSGFDRRPRPGGEIGRVGRFPVLWYAANRHRSRDDRPRNPYARETLIVLPTPKRAYARTVHIWINARSFSELDDSLRILSRVQFE